MHVRLEASLFLPCRASGSSTPSFHPHIDAVVLRYYITLREGTRPKEVNCRLVHCLSIQSFFMHNIFYFLSFLHIYERILSLIIIFFLYSPASDIYAESLRIPCWPCLFFFLTWCCSLHPQVFSIFHSLIISAFLVRSL